jgi:hypothetical protein
MFARVGRWARSRRHRWKRRRWSTGAAGTVDDRREPPRQLWYHLDEAIELLAVLEDAQLTALDAGALALVMVLERQIELLHRKLEIGDGGGADG